MRIPPPLPQPITGFNTAWASNLIRELDSFFDSLRSGDQQIRGRFVTAGGRRIAVIDVTTASDTLRLTDEFVAVNFAGTVALTLPAGPGLGQRIVVQDASGAAGTNTITISPATGTINGGPNVQITTNYGRRTLIYSGSEWLSD